MARLSVSKAWDEASAILQREAKLFIPLALAMLVLPSVVAGVLAPPAPGALLPNRILGGIAAIIGFAGQLALVRLALGASVSVKEAIAHGIRRVPILIGCLILLGILFLLLIIPFAVVGAAAGVPVPEPGAPQDPRLGGLILLILIVMVAIAARFMLATAICSEERIGPFAVLRRSWDLSKGHYWRLLAVFVLLMILVLVLVSGVELLAALLARVVAPEITPLSLGAFIIAVAGSLAQAVCVAISSVLTARIYAQLALGNETVSVPSSRD